MTAIPERTLRHFPEGLGDLDDPAVRGAITARLLEDGDRDDLAWWVGAVGRAWLLEWIDRHSARRLSRRSRAYWRAAAGLGGGERPRLAEALWPLA